MSILDFLLFSGRVIRRLKMIFFYRFFFIECGKKSLIIKPILLSHDCISLGDCVLIRNNARIEGVFKFKTQIFNPHVFIGNNVNIEQNVHITCTDSISIGNITSITANVTITDTIHNYCDTQIASKSQPLSSKKVKIGNNCFIYNNSVILPGSELGDGVIVAANSVVNGSFPSFTVVGGNPAKIIKIYNPKTKSWEKVL